VSHLISRIALAQLAAIVVGFLVVCIRLKLEDYPDEFFFTFTWSAKFLREFGWMLV